MNGNQEKMPKKKSPPKSKKFEALLTRLEEIVKTLEEGELELEDALAAFEEGVKLSRELSDRLNQAEERVNVLLRTVEGELKTTPFEQTAPVDDE